MTSVHAKMSVKIKKTNKQTNKQFKKKEEEKARLLFLEAYNMLYIMCFSPLQ